MMKRILAIDIGNTAATVGFYEGGRLLDFGSIYYNDIPKYAIKCLKSGKNSHLDVVISSVFPKITCFIECKLQNKNGLSVWVLGRDIPVKIRHNYNDFNGLGCDRKVNVYGAMQMYRLPILVIDYGTAITFDYIDSKGVFQGGMIIPGPETAYRALSQRAALLPKGIAMPKKQKSFLGRNARECMESGILEGYGAMTDELIQRFRKRYGKNLRVLATGGFAEVIRPYTKHIDTIDPKHSIKSILALFREHLKKSS
ncbi:MAG TPA: type III pantothenate kinase [Candidatus Omnitrophota bacterium]|nr:type III pantothenate kinase [Candidatus Omnitrophota bacterium]HRY85655.1 type III pantothenate kinase [Candidatus Omnitrophota bacterium]